MTEPGLSPRCLVLEPSSLPVALNSIVIWAQISFLAVHSVPLVTYVSLSWYNALNYYDFTISLSYFFLHFEFEISLSGFTEISIGILTGILWNL